MGFDSEGVRTECWAVADVCHGIESFARDRERSDVDADSRNEFRVRRKVDSRNGVATSIAAAGCWRTENGKGLAKERAGTTDVAGGDKFSETAGGNNLTTKGSWSVDLDVEAELTA